MEPPIIAVAGCSCSGKTTLAEFLARELGGEVLPVDAYYRDLSHLSPAERARTNFDQPEAIEYELLIEHLWLLRAGEGVMRPIYDFTTHTRSLEQVRIEGGTPLIIEGIFALYRAAVRELADLRVFVDLADDLCFKRRLERDTRARGRTAESVRRQYAETVRPMAELHVVPTRRYADVVVSGDAPVQTTGAEVLARLSLG